MTLLFQFQKMMNYLFELKVQVLITQTLILELGWKFDKHTIPTQLDWSQHCLFYGYDDVGRGVSYGGNSAGDMGSYFSSFCSHSPRRRLTDGFLDSG